MDIVGAVATEAAKTMAASMAGMLITGAGKLLRSMRRRIGVIPRDPDELVSALARMIERDPAAAAEIIDGVAALRPANEVGARALPVGLFVDREAHRRQVARPGVWLVAGSHGVGKTAFVTQVCADLAAEFPAGRAYVDLDEFRDGEVLRSADVKASVLRQLGVEALDVVEPELSQQYQAALLHGGFVLVFDNALGSEEVRSLALPWPASVVLVTTRRLTDDLRMWSPRSPVVLHGLDERGAWELLASRCGEKMLADQPQQTRQLLDGCDRMPFAVLQVGVRLSRRQGEPGAVGAILAEFGSTIDSPGIIRRCLDGTFAELSDAVRADLLVLANHPGEDFTRDSADAMLGRSSRPTVDELLDVCLVLTSGDGRLRLHRLVRAYLAEVHQGSPADLDAAFDRVLALYCDRAVAVDLSKGDRLRCYQPRTVTAWPASSLSPMDWLEAEATTIADLVAEAHRRGRHVEVGQLCGVLELLLTERGHHQLCLAADAWGVSSARALGEVALQARIESMRGRVFTVLHRFDLAETALDTAARLAEPLDHPRLKSSISEFRGRLREESAEYAAVPDYTAAEAALRDSIAIDRAAGLPRGLHIHTRMLANVLVKDGRPTQALSLLADATGADERNNARVHTVRAKAFAALDRLAEAQAEVDSARTLSRAIGATQYEYELTDIEADLAARSGAVESARALWGEIAERYFHAGHPRFDVYLRKLSQLPPAPR